jgi:glycosyltransferase involved in cell wall biosynthesis
MGALGAPRRTKLLFDDRGFMPEEYVDAGVWRAGGVVFRVMKAVERRLLRRADAVVVLTERARAVVAPQLAVRGAGAPPVEVIPCCVDLAAFPLPTAADRDAAKRRLGVGGRSVALYVGSSTGTYLLEELADFVLALREADPGTYLLVLTPRGVGQVTDLLRARGLDTAGSSVRAVPPAEVATHAAAADVGLCFIAPTYAKQASSPTKVAEYLASGLPVVVTAGVGDLDAQVTGSRVGVLVHDLDRAGYRRAGAELRQLLLDPGLARRCRAAAEARFGLATVGAPRYVSLYARLLGTAAP